jgi:hypothetical protein
VWGGEMNGFDLVFVISATVFNLLIVGIYLTQKFGKVKIARQLGICALALTIPFLVVFVAYLFEGKELRILIIFPAIFIYMFLELLWDYLIKVDFRSKPLLHIPYIILFYIVLFGNIAIAFGINRTWGWVVTVTFWILLAALVFSLIKPPLKPKSKT